MLPRTLASPAELQLREQYAAHYRKSPIPPAEFLATPGVFVSRQALTKLLFYQHLYQQILGLPGQILDFGPRWGQSTVTLTNLRGIYEPYNYSRVIHAFDWWDTEGAPTDWQMPDGYGDYLVDLVRLHEAQSPLSHLNKLWSWRGSVEDTLPRMLKHHPETMAALTIIDLGDGGITEKVLRALHDRFFPGSIIVCNPLASEHWPHVTEAYREYFREWPHTLHRFPESADCAYVRLA